jgi:hypothetical protein
VKGFIKDVSDMAGSVHDFVAFIKNPLAGPPKGQDYIAQASTAARNWLSGVWENRNLPPDVARASGSSPAGLRMKPGAGNIDAGLGALALDLQKNIPGFNRVTSADDSYHKHITSAHNQGRAFDFTLSDGANYAQTKRLIEAELKRLNIKGRVINEADHPIPGRTTAPHLHVQTDKTVDVRIFNAAGSSFVTHTTMNAAGVPQ